jgi:microcystin-dependent protein
MITPYVGEVALYAYNLVPPNWAACDGHVIEVTPQYAPLFETINYAWGGEGPVLNLPDYRQLSPQSMQYCIATIGITPGAGGRPSAVGEISLLPYSTPTSWLQCNGGLYHKSDFNALFEVIGNTFGGDGEATFGVPNLIKTPPPFPPAQPDSPLYCISTSGPALPTPFLGEVRLFPFTSAPAGWKVCNGETVPLNQNQALFSLLGTSFGGDGRTEVGLPNLSHSAVPHGLQYFIAVEGTYPATFNPPQEMAEEDRRGMFRPPSELCP